MSKANEREQKLKNITSIVRALVTSRKPPCTLREILREYPEVDEKPLQFRALGYNTAEELLKETGEFIFNRIGNELCITAKTNSKSAHIKSMVREQKSSKTTRITAVAQKQVRQPKRTDQSWNKSLYSANVYRQLPPASNRFLNSQNRANGYTSTTGSGGSGGVGGSDRNNNTVQQHNRQQQLNKQPQQQATKQQHQQQTNKQYQNKQAHQQQQQQPTKQHQQVQRQKSGNSSGAAEQVKDLREMLNSKVQPTGQMNAAVGGGQKDLRNLLNAKGAQQQQQKVVNGNKADLRERLQMGQQTTQQQQQQQQQQISPRPILGQNNNNNNNAPTAALQLLQNNAAVAIASSLILAQREQMLQEQQQQQQQLQEQQQPTKTQKHPRQNAEWLSMQQNQPQHQPQQMYARATGSGSGAAGVTANQKTLHNGSGGGVTGIDTSSSSIQDRLRIKISNGGNRTFNDSNGGGGCITPATTPPPLISSPGSEKMQNPYGNAKFHNNKRFTKTPQQQLHNQQQPVIPPKIFQFNPKLDPITSLSQYCVVRRCPLPEYSIVKSKFSRLYQCRVQVNGSIYSTYPNEYPNEQMAKISCAFKAIEQIQLQEARRPLPPCTDTDEDLTERLYTELLKHPHGIFAKNMPEWFETTFQHTLPKHWFTLVQTFKKFNIETTANNTVIIFANTDYDKDDQSAITMQMEGIVLPWQEKYWDLYITHCASTVEVWARLFGKEFSERFDNLMNDIDMYMLKDKARPLSLAAKQVYLVSIAECWHRVRVEELDKLNGTALCFFIDFGDVEWLAVSKLHICETQFLRLPAQAVPFSLFGLEDFAGNPNARRHLDALLPSKSVVGEILTKETDFYATDSNTSGKVQVVLYDTSTPEDVNLNPLLLNQICNDMPPPEIKRTGVTNVLVTHINDAGDLYLQIQSNELKYVQKLIQQLIESKFKRDQHKLTRDDLKCSNLFLICEEDVTTTANGEQSAPNWYRGALSDTHFSADDEEFDIFYVDHGKTKRTHISKMFRLESLSTALSKYPRQAIKARLHNIPEITNIIVGRMRALLPSNCEALVKLAVVSVVPLVTVYRRLEGRDTDTLCTINDVIRIEHELASADEKNGPLAGSSSSVDNKKNSGFSSPTTNITFVDLTRGLTFTSVPNSPQKCSDTRKLRNYEEIPLVNDYFEVRVTMSANPSNFTIQPYKPYPQLRDLMKELQEYCENNDEFIPADMVEIGQAYAAKNPDGFYHRVTVVNTYNYEMIHVCFCDFGDIAILRCDQLKILPAKFRQLSKMAIQAKLYGITARHIDWTLEDCLRFRELTVGQKFVSVIKKMSYDQLTTPPTPILELELIDVTTDEDVFIHKILLTEGRAVEETADGKASVDSNDDAAADKN